MSTHRISSRISSLILSGIMIVALAGCAATENRASTGQYLDDTLITAKVKTGLMADPSLKATEINVETFRGTVQLSGFVSSPEQIPEAIRLAQNIQGVEEVRNALVVKSRVPNE